MKNWNGVESVQDLINGQYKKNSYTIAAARIK